LILDFEINCSAGAVLLRAAVPRLLSRRAIEMMIDPLFHIVVGWKFSGFCVLPNRRGKVFSYKTETPFSFLRIVLKIRNKSENNEELKSSHTIYCTLRLF
jgi:hypothetical protein